MPKSNCFFIMHSPLNILYRHCAVGRAMRIYCISEQAGKKYLTAGGILPYYEFDAERIINDESWKEQLSSSLCPDFADWQKEFICETSPDETIGTPAINIQEKYAEDTEEFQLSPQDTERLPDLMHYIFTRSNYSPVSSEQLPSFAAASEFFDPHFLIPYYSDAVKFCLSPSYRTIYPDRDSDIYNCLMLIGLDRKKELIPAANSFLGTPRLIDKTWGTYQIRQCDAACYAILLILTEGESENHYYSSEAEADYVIDELREVLDGKRNFSYGYIRVTTRFYSLYSETCDYIDNVFKMLSSEAGRKIIMQFLQTNIFGFSVIAGLIVLIIGMRIKERHRIRRILESK